MIFGGTMACLTAALCAARAGRSVRLFLPTRGVGNGFLGLRTGPYHLEFGTRLIETTAGPERLDIAHYVVGAPIRPFVADIRAFLADILGDDGLRPLSSAVAAFRGRCLPDFVSSLDFQPLSETLSSSELKTIKRELAARIDRPNRSVFTRAHRPLLEGDPLGDVCLANHGELFQRLVIEPYAAQVWSAWPGALASHRQKLWIPIFYPETIAGGLGGHLQRFRPAVTYGYPRDGTMSAIVNGLLAQLRARVEVVEYDDPATLRGTPDVCGLSVQETLRLTDAPPLVTFPLTVSWFAVPRAAMLRRPAFIALHDRTAPGFRISFGGRAPATESLVTVEGRRCPEPTEVSECLGALGVLDPAADAVPIRSARVPLVAPTRDNVATLAAARRRLWPTRWVGPAAGLRFDTLNEQIAQGIKLGLDPLSESPQRWHATTASATDAAPTFEPSSSRAAR